MTDPDPFAFAYRSARGRSRKRHLRWRGDVLYTACGRAKIDPDSAVSASTVPHEDRCRQSGCHGRWAAIDARGATS